MARVKEKFTEDELKETRKKVLSAFKSLRKYKIRARSNFLCCGPCASYGIDLTDKIGGVWWHGQDEDCFRETGCLYIGFTTENGEGADKIAERLVSELKARNLWVEWDGSGGTRVLVKVKAGL